MKLKNTDGWTENLSSNSQDTKLSLNVFPELSRRLHSCQLEDVGKQVPPNRAEFHPPNKASQSEKQKFAPSRFLFSVLALQEKCKACPRDQPDFLASQPRSLHTSPHHSMSSCLPKTSHTRCHRAQTPRSFFLLSISLALGLIALRLGHTPLLLSGGMSSNCCKCQSDTSDIVIRNTTWCRSCFVDQLSNKFSQAIRPAKEYCRPPKGSQKLASDYGSLLIHYTDDLASLVALHLLKNYLAANQARSTTKWKVPIDFSTIQVVWVDLGSASKYSPSGFEQINDQDPNSTISASSNNISNIKSTVESFGFKFLVLKLHDLFAPPPCQASSDSSSPKYLVNLSQPTLPIKVIDPSLSPPPQSSCPLEEILQPLTKTSRSSMLTNLVSSRLLSYCKESKRPKVLVKTTNSTQMAIDTLASVSLGAGWSLSQQIGSSSYVDDVFICRPLAHIVNAELYHFAQLNQLSHTRPISNPLEKKHDVHALLTDFVIKLEEPYPMTSAVINQTASKIGHVKDLDVQERFSNIKTCSICRLSSDPNANQWKQSITLASHSQSPIMDQSLVLANNLCYSCLVMFRDHQSSQDQRPSNESIWAQLPHYSSFMDKDPSPRLESFASEKLNGSVQQIEKILQPFMIDD
ncbi:hypothetical protein O181_025234 [Austropuccinia psidii MF-1]|uniref:Cytoplasmic tRNA 2-thiolation protein 2 n=1 Tax=Austropuccinia psidii MF-1 TaxID=1389203 RepID=A0A9Q3CHN4_9BASI|nr:hypothetical protein [Austropuccinia psidii MF-1]